MDPNVPNESGVTGEGEGRRYSDEYKRQLAVLWATGFFPSDSQMLKALGDNAPTQATVIRWRQNKEPHGLDWEELRREFQRRAEDAVQMEFGQTVAEMNVQFYSVGRAMLGMVVEAIKPGPLYLDRELTRPVQRLYREDGSVVRLRPALCPSNPSELVRLLAEAIKQMRMARGEASERVELIASAQDEFTRLLRDAIIELGWEPERVRELQGALNRAFGIENGVSEQFPELSSDEDGW